MDVLLVRTNWSAISYNLMKTNVNLKIMPFGHVSIEIKGYEMEREAREKESPVYVVPKTTGPQSIEIENYLVPKTTGGLY